MVARDVGRLEDEVVVERAADAGRRGAQREDPVLARAVEQAQDAGRHAAALADHPVDLGALDLHVLGGRAAVALQHARGHRDRAARRRLVAGDLDAHAAQRVVAAVGDLLGEPALHLPAERQDEVGEGEHVLGVHLHVVVVGDHGGTDRHDAPVLHRALQLAADLGRLDGAAEEAHDRPFDDALEELFEPIEPRHASTPAAARCTASIANAECGVRNAE